MFTMQLLGRAVRSSAGMTRMIRGIAGMPAGVRRSRRGTVLVLILGALALIAVLTIVYVGVGQTDRRMSVTVAQTGDVKTSVQKIADYIAQVIADSTVATAVDGKKTVNGLQEPILYHPFMDYPFTDPYRKSVGALNWSTNANGSFPEKFNPTGSYDDVFSAANANAVDPRMPSTPWLASTVPTSDPNSPTPDAPTEFGHISDLAPNGAFVNLWNLAPIVGSGANGVRYTAWDADSGFDPTQGPKAPFIDSSVTPNRIASQMSYGLTLLDEDGNPTGASGSGSGPQLPNRARADANIPAHWSTHQQQMFRPAQGPVFYPGSTNDPSGFNGNSPASMYYAPYQYADTDGDGFFDARWFELVDSSDFKNIRSILPQGDRYRWFAAVRVVDLNALVNVNTAMDYDSVPRPNQGATSGRSNDVTPLGDIPEFDLKRLFKMTDVDKLPPLTSGGTGGRDFGYGAFLQPTVSGSNEDYTGDNAATAATVGTDAYNALRYMMTPNSVEVPAPTFTLPTYVPLTPDQRVAYYQRQGSNAAGAFIEGATVGTQGTISINARMGMSDLLELFTFRTENNPSTLSRLEQVLDGRDTTGGAAAFGPMRSNRGGALESYTADPLTTGIADPKAIARVKYDLRQYLTPVNGAREMFSTLLRDNATRSTLVTPDLAGYFSRLTPAVTYDPPLPIESQRINARTAVDAALGLQAPLYTTSVPADCDPSQLFMGYAQALLPHASEPFSWDWQGHKPLQTLAYGGSPERALRIAGAMTLNLIASAKKDSTPVAATLLVDETYRGSVDATKFPTWNEPGNTVNGVQVYPGRLDFGKANLANGDSGSGVTVGSKAVNLYGIQAQPVVTEASSFFFYADTPHADGGDDEYTPAFPPITIDGSYDLGAGGATGGRPGTNKDFRSCILAFQLTNPFDVDIPLTADNLNEGDDASSASGDSAYYIEFAKQYYKIVDLDEASGTTKAVVLKAGTSRVFYVLPDKMSVINGKWNIGGGSTGGRISVKTFADGQFTVTSGSTTITPVHIEHVDAGGAAQTAAFDPFSGVVGTTPSRTIHLWHKLTTSNGSRTGNRTNDILVDRLRDPSTTTSTLFRKLVGGTQLVAGTHAGPDDGSGDPQDNTGMAIVLWNDLKRHDDPGGGGTGVPTGGIPAYCLEAHWAGAATGGRALKNVTHKDGASEAGLDRHDFLGAQQIGTHLGDHTMSDLIGRLGSANQLLIPSLAKPANKKTGDAMLTNIDGRKYVDLYPEIYIDANGFRKQQQASSGSTPPPISVLRVTDLLMPLGICPSYAPLSDATNGGTAAPSENTNDEHPGRITLTEALAIALNYSVPTGVTGPGDPYAVFVANPTQATGGQYGTGIGDATVGCLDRGNLVLDRQPTTALTGTNYAEVFVPYEDKDSSGNFTAGDVPRFPRIPLAMHILDVFTTAAPEMTGASIPGMININTAPRLVASMLPLMTPTDEGTVWDTWINKANGGTPPTDAILPTKDFDVTAGVFAYRDRTSLKSRKTTAAPNGVAVRFDDAAGAGEFAPNTWTGRTDTNKIGGIREQPGFSGRGELLAVYDRAGTPPLFNTRAPLTSQIDELGRDTDGHYQNPPVAGTRPLNSGFLGTNTSSYKNPADTTQRIPSKITNSYAEKLIVASGIMNSITTRSDVFAVWFVVQGYQKSDTEGLHPLYAGDPTPPDPLVPSIAKRYLMVVDRSNVTRLGQKPKVLLFTEVPMTNFQPANQ